jgi:hypothetical protein
MSERPEPERWPPPGWEKLPWRAGRQIGRTVLLQMGDEPDLHDPTIGMMDTAGLGELVVQAVNFYREYGPNGR